MTSFARTSPFVALIALAACNKGDSDTSSNPGTCDQPTPEASAAAYTDKWGVDGTNPDCEELVLTDCTVHLEGATRFYAGALAWDSTGAVGGYEADVLYANDAWRASDSAVSDCQIVWTVTGTKTDGPPPYAYTLTLHAAVNHGASDCVPGLVNAASAWDGSYHVSQAGSDATLYFGDSGNLFATGNGSDSCVEYVSDGSCEWYGSDTCTP